MAGQPGADALSACVIDPFELPEWLGSGPVGWEQRGQSERFGAVIRGLLTSYSPSDTQVDLPCDLVAIDAAYPQPIIAEKLRAQAHQAWTHGQVLTLQSDERLQLAVPGVALDVPGLLEALRRLAKAVGAEPARFRVTLGLG